MGRLRVIRTCLPEISKRVGGERRGHDDYFVGFVKTDHNSKIMSNVIRRDVDHDVTAVVSSYGGGPKIDLLSRHSLLTPADVWVELCSFVASGLLT